MVEFEEDEEFLSQVAAAEAAAIASQSSASKRRRISAVETPTSAVNASKTATTSNVVEGAYTAALRGSKSLEFQKQMAILASASRQSHKPYSTGFNSNSSNSTSDSGNSCFKCGKSGHWARDCDTAPTNDEFDPSSPPEKKCPCGIGNCIVLTANTERNRGRKFYKCPMRQENGGCDFFEWCDKPSFTYNTSIQTVSAANLSVPELSCPCGGGPCLVLTAKTGKNIGQQFYRCPNQESCGFFKWCNEMTSAVGSMESQNAPQFYQSVNSMSNRSNSSGTCFKCGKEGHWARDCANSSTSLSSPADGVGKSATTTTCFKCGRPGHWAKDCTSVAPGRQYGAK